MKPQPKRTNRTQNDSADDTDDTDDTLKELVQSDTPDIKLVCSKVQYVMYAFDERVCSLGYKFTQLNTEFLKEQLVNETILHSIIFSLFLHH
jgi:hypothetical protein